MKYHPALEQLLTSLHVAPLKRYGQNFLIDDQVINTIINVAKIKNKQNVLEIGPGLGAITQGLDLANIQYTSYEIDVTFHRYLQKTYPQGTHHRQNFLKATSEQMDVVLGNLPYYMTTEILEKIYKDFSSLKRAVLMVQKEVMPRLTAQPGDETYGPLAIFLATLGTITPILEVSPVSFYPEPHIQSMIFQLDAFPKGPLVDPKPFFYFIKKLFLHRRKTILNNVISLGVVRPEAEALLSTIKVAPNARPETISVHEYLSLFELISHQKTI
jgi:16S rRNA (adenine1518-N6/adenine1519-N6)-dimethyltransferase